MKKIIKKNTFLLLCYRFAQQVIDPQKFVKGIKGFFWYFGDYRKYKKMQGSESLSFRDLEPAFHEHSDSHELDAHYFYVNSWAMRLIVKQNPSRHYDVASQTILASLLSAVIPVTYLDFRILEARLSGLECKQGNLMDLPFENNTINSISCLHVAEHIGLGRYNDPLDPFGTQKAAKELQRVLAPGGNLYFALPIGRERVCFNSHRIHSAETIQKYFNELELLEFSAVRDNGEFIENTDFSEFGSSTYACGMFHFRKIL